MNNHSTALKVLYVEDDPDIQTIARIALEDIGKLEICACESGAQALLAIETFKPDLILLDVMMPGMDGPTLLAHLRKTSNGSDAKVIFMTARVQQNEVQQYLTLGAVDVVAKPFDPLTLADQLIRMFCKQSA